MIYNNLHIMNLEDNNITMKILSSFKDNTNKANGGYQDKANGGYQDKANGGYQDKANGDNKYKANGDNKYKANGDNKYKANGSYHSNNNLSKLDDIILEHFLADNSILSCLIFLLDKNHRIFNYHDNISSIKKILLKYLFYVYQQKDNEFKYDNFKEIIDTNNISFISDLIRVNIVIVNENNKPINFTYKYDHSIIIKFINGVYYPMIYNYSVTIFANNIINMFDEYVSRPSNIEKSNFDILDKINTIINIDFNDVNYSNKNDNIEYNNQNRKYNNNLVNQDENIKDNTVSNNSCCTSAALGCCTSAAPGCCTPAAPGCCTPAAPGCCTSAAPGCCTPAAPGCCTPAAPGCCTPAAPGCYNNVNKIYNKIINKEKMSNSSINSLKVSSLLELCKLLKYDNDEFYKKKQKKNDIIAVIYQYIT